ncbi:hypothetical protein V6R21_21390 [Limibacter armeniacum]|uniref:hypothetical protein n=1 Tax=Limibacter armeniacum TaxID=466084 RepID=UPI002FE65D54
MRKKLLDTSFLMCYYYPSLRLLEAEWKPETRRMKDADYKKTMLGFVENVTATKPRFILVKATDFVYVIDPEVQQWVNNEVISVLIDTGAEKMAFTLNPDLITQLSIEQTMDSPSAKTYLQTHYFVDEKKARKWLMEV